MINIRKAITRGGAVVIVTSIFYALLWLIFNDVDSVADRERLAENDAAQSATISQLENDLATEQATSLALADQLARLGIEPEVEPGPTIIEQSTPLSLIQTLIDAGINARCGGSSCRGDRGADGVSIAGPKGEPGETVVGAEGRPGVDGAPGTPGAPGRGIASGPTCMPDGTWSTSYTDGTVENQPGPCRLDIIPPPPTDPPVEVTP